MAHENASRMCAKYDHWPGFAYGFFGPQLHPSLFELYEFAYRA